jgi:phosphopantetheinyl transferase (holo-ACP synthase)
MTSFLSLRKPPEALHGAGCARGDCDSACANARRVPPQIEIAEFSDESGQVIYTWDHCGFSAGDRAARQAIKLQLASFLWSHDKKMLYTDRETTPEIAWGGASLTNDDLGGPHLMLDGRRGPAISFSYCAERLWACMGHGEISVGIDSAWAGEFQNGYPYARVFDPTEFEGALAMNVGGPPEAAALLWSAKEAVVKALGCGFHLVAPHEVTLVPKSGASTERRFALRIAQRARRRLGISATGNTEIAVSRHSRFWVSVAVSTGAVSW